MQLHTYLTFNDCCETALNFYRDALGGEILYIMRAGDSPMAKDIPQHLHQQIMHARIRLGDQIVMASDRQAGDPAKAQGFHVTITAADTAEAERIYQALQVKSEIHMPLQETFWALRFAMLTDQFGIPWMINCDRPMVS